MVDNRIFKNQIHRPHETNHVGVRFGKNIRNPYDMRIDDVNPYHFQDARLYDPQLTEKEFAQLNNSGEDLKSSGWTVPRKFYNKKYNEWLANVRETPGNMFFRKIMVEIQVIEEDSEGKCYMINKKVPLHPKKVKTLQHRNIFFPQSKEKGIGVDDQHYVPRMFTAKMGREISSLRNGLEMTQTELAKKINVDVSVIRNIESGTSVSYNPDDKLVKSLAFHLKVSTIKYQE